MLDVYISLNICKTFVKAFAFSLYAFLLFPINNFA